MRLVLIEWVDSFGCSTNWEEIQDPFPDPQPMTCRSVGWLVYDGENCKVLVPHLADCPDGPRQGCGDMTIPTSAVVRMEDLAGGRDED